MVTKLFKYEFTYYLRTFGLFLPIVLVVAAATRVFKLFDDTKAINRIAIGSSSALLFMACAALITLSVVAGVVRFYKNMYSSEGYLTFTLPVTHTQHIFVKIVVAMACQAICVFTVIAATCIALVKEELAEVLKAFADIVKDSTHVVGAVNTALYIFEFILLVVLAVAMNMLLYYACITIGQTAKKNRILMAVGAYFAYYIATQILSTLFIIIVAILGETGVLNSVVDCLIENPAASVHVILGLIIGVYAAMSALFWIVTQTIMTKKLNLE